MGEKNKRKKKKRKKRERERKPPKLTPVSGMNWGIPKAGLNFYGLWHFLFLNIPNVISVSLAELFTGGWYNCCGTGLQRNFLIPWKPFKAVFSHCPQIWSDQSKPGQGHSKGALPKQILQNNQILFPSRVRTKPQKLWHFLDNSFVCFSLLKQMLSGVEMPLPYSFAPLFGDGKVLVQIRKPCLAENGKQMGFVSQIYFLFPLSIIFW